jgi:hypothetical protein
VDDQLPQEEQEGRDMEQVVPRNDNSNVVENQHRKIAVAVLVPPVAQQEQHEEPTQLEVSVYQVRGAS